MLLQIGYNGLKGTHLMSRFAPPANYPDLSTLNGLIAQKLNFSTNEPNPFGITQQGYTALLPYQNFFNQSLQEILQPMATQVQNPHDLGNERSVSNFDVPVSLTTGYTYELPIGHNKWISMRNRFLDLVVGNWVTSGIYNVQSGISARGAEPTSGFWGSATLRFD